MGLVLMAIISLLLVRSMVRGGQRALQAVLVLDEGIGAQYVDGLTGEQAQGGTLRVRMWNEVPGNLIRSVPRRNPWA